MATLPHLLTLLWGRRSPAVASAYREAFGADSLLRRDLAIFCNAAAPIAGQSDFERGVEEGKRRVWLHLARLSGLEPHEIGRAHV